MSMDKYNTDYPKDIPQTEYHPIKGSVDWTGYEHHACWVDGCTSSLIGRPTAMQVGPDIYIPHQ